MIDCLLSTFTSEVPDAGVGINVATEYLVPETRTEDCWFPLAGADGFADPSANAIEAFAAQPDRGDRELSSAAVWHRYIYY